MKERRPSQENDQANVEKAYQLIKELMSQHPEIEGSLWAGAVWSVFVNGYKQSDFSYEDFCQEVKDACAHSKCWWTYD